MYYSLTFIFLPWAKYSTYAEDEGIRRFFLWVQHLLELRHRRLGYLPGIAQLRCEYLIGWMNWYVARAALVQFLHIEDDGQGQANVHEELERDWPEKIRNTFSCIWFFLFLHIFFFSYLKIVF